MNTPFLSLSKFILSVIALVLLVMAGLDAYQTLIQEPISPKDPPVFIPGKNTAVKNPDQKKEFKINDYKENIWHPRIDERIKEVFGEVKEKWGLKLSGIIIEPNTAPIAFIIDASGNERLYSVGDVVGSWNIKQIEKNQVLLVNPEGNEMVLRLELAASLTVKPIPQETNLSVSPLEEAPSDAKLRAAGRTSQIDKNELLTRVKPLLETLPEETVYKGIKEITGISREDIPPNTNLQEYVTKLIQISQDGVLPEARQTAKMVNIVFSLQVNPDDSARNPTTIFAETDKKIYACFSSQGDLQGLKNVVTRWTNLAAGDPGGAGGGIVYIGNKPIDPSAPNNFVWVEKQKGWIKGFYQVEFFKPGTLEKVAQGRFEVR
jgi:type II secretory pathway component PulC